jgi:hypothetical protein
MVSHNVARIEKMRGGWSGGERGLYEMKKGKFIEGRII